jgi:hypothetical protein
MVGRLFESTDPRDKVYAVLGLARVPLENTVQTGEDTAADAACVMRIDYNASVSEVYQYTAKYIINRNRNLDILCILSANRDDLSDDLPTWTPDWRVPTSKVPLHAHFEYYTYKWGAAGFTKSLWQSQDDIGRLLVEGFTVATVTQLYGAASTSLPGGKL